jgi:hypothetical protein
LEEYYVDGEMKENNLNVYQYDVYNKREQKELAKQRAIKGYCDNDLFCINGWFLEIIPGMLIEFSKQVTSYPYELIEEYYKKNQKKIGVSLNRFIEIDNNDCSYYNSPDDKRVKHYTVLADKWASKEWKGIIKKIAYLFNECREDTCTHKKRYEDEYLKASEDNKDKLINKDEKGNTIHHLLSYLPEYKDLENKWWKENQRIEAYQEKCKNEAFSLMSKWFNRLGN